MEGTGNAWTAAMRTISESCGSSNWELFKFEAKTGAFRPTGSGKCN